MSALHIPGEQLTQLDKRRIAKILWLQAAVFFIGGVVATVLNHPEGLIGAVFALPMLWVGRYLGAARLVVTSAGIYYVRGKGFNLRPVIVDSADWQVIDDVKLVTRRTGSGSRASTSHTMIIGRGEAEPLKYLIGFVQPDRVAALAKACKQRGIAVSV